MLALVFESETPNLAVVGPLSPAHSKKNESGRKKLLNVQGTAFLGIRASVPGTPPAPWHKLDIPRISETVPGNRPVSSQEPGCSSKLTTAFQDAYKHYPHQLDKPTFCSHNSLLNTVPAVYLRTFTISTCHRVLHIVSIYISSDFSLYLLTLRYCGSRLPRCGYLLGNQFTAVL